MASIYQRGKLCPSCQIKREKSPKSKLCRECDRRVWWILYYDPTKKTPENPGGKIQRSLRTRDRRVAEHEKRKIENDLDLGPSESGKAFVSNSRMVENYLSLTQGTITDKQHSEEKTILKRFVDYIGIRNIKDVDEETVKGFVFSRTKTVRGKEVEISDRSKNGYIVTLKKFYRRMKRNGYLSNNPVEFVRQIRLTKNPPQWLDSGKDGELLEALSEKDRDFYLMAALGIYAGLRFAEIMSLTWKDVYWRDGGRTGMIAVLNKGGVRTKSRKYRYVPLAAALEAILSDFKGKNDAYIVFPEHRPRKAYKWYNKKFRGMCREAGFPLPAGKAFHILRHTFGSKHGQAGRSIYKLAEWMGHSTVQMTKIYAHLDPADSEIDNI